MADRPQREPVVEGEREIAAGHENGRKCDSVGGGGFQCGDHLVDIEVVQHVHEHRHRDGDNRDTKQEADPLPADFVLEKARHGAQ